MAGTEGPGVSYTKLRAVLLVVIAAAAVLAVSGRVASATVTPKSALIYGDSLTYESRAWVTQEFATKAGWVQHPHQFPGFALCDFQAWLPADLAAYHPSVVAVESAGNTTRPCMLDANGNQLDPTSDAFFAKYHADMHAFFKAVTDTGATVLWVDAPPMLNTEWDSRILKLEAVAKEVAASYPGVSVSTVPRNQVSNAGKYTATKPCLRTETVAQGCGLPGPGLIWIRTVVGIQTGIHFCPGGLEAGVPYPCDADEGNDLRQRGVPMGYSRGRHHRQTSAPPILPTVNLMRKAAVEGQPLMFTPKLKFPYRAT